MRYFKITDEGRHDDWGGYPTYWLEVNEAGNAEREINKYPNRNVLSYDKLNVEDEHGALSIMVIDGDDNFWTPYEITKEEFELEWNTILPLNR